MRGPRGSSGDVQTWLIEKILANCFANDEKEVEGRERGKYLGRMLVFVGTRFTETKVALIKVTLLKGTPAGKTRASATVLLSTNLKLIRAH